MMQQYLSIKEKYPDAILFYRMGDFYEMFFEDAEVASKALEITLTSRNKNDKAPVPMCGIPYRAAQGYIGRLIEGGFKVAVCDQVEDPATAKGLVKREVVRVITPGMVLEDTFLEEKSHNFVLAAYHMQERYGLACLDISTGTFRVTETGNRHAILEEALRISPREVIMPGGGTEPFLNEITSALNGTAISHLDEREFAYGRSRQRLIEHFNTVSLEGFGCNHLKAAIGAAGGLMAYVLETQKQKLGHIESIETYYLDSFLWLDESSCRNLELIKNLRSGTRQGTLLGVLDKTLTPMGGRLIRQWLRYPLLDKEKIEARLDAVQEAMELHIHSTGLRERLKSVYDLERLGSKIGMGQCSARDLLALKQSLQQLPELESGLQNYTARLYRGLEHLGELADLAGLIDDAIREDAPPTIHEGGMIKPGFNPELDQLIQISRDGKGWLLNLEATEKEQSGIGSLKVRYNKVFGYYIEVPKAHSESVPPHYVRKQTLVNAERYITDELKKFENEVMGAEEKRATMERDVFNEIRSAVVHLTPEIQMTAKFIARIDALLSFAEVAVLGGYCRPEINREGVLDIEEGRHPVVEKMISGERFVPNTIHMDQEGVQILIITGPNMAGKSTVLRQVAIFVLMAQAGCFVPAAKANISITDKIFTRVGALDNLSAGQSTFMVEMEETANILNNATPDSLVILDEIGRGTSTFDGLSIAWAVAEYLHDLDEKGAKTLFATHYHELTELSKQKHRVQNFNIAVKEWNDEIIFLRKLVEGGTNRSYGIQVARLAGIPESVIKRSKKILYQIENDSHLSPNTTGEAIQKRKEKGAAVQIEMFQTQEKTILDRLKSIDVTRMTPLEALNVLDEICMASKSGSN
jgi:DNA mismatch repair protein MutS